MTQVEPFIASATTLDVKQKTVWSQLVGQCISLENLLTFQCQIIGTLSGMMTNRDLSLSKVSILTIFHLQKKTGKADYGLIEPTVVKDFLRRLADVILAHSLTQRQCLDS